MHIKFERVLAGAVVKWFEKVDDVPLLVEDVTMLEVVGEVLLKDAIVHIVLLVVFVKLVVPRIVVVIMELVAFFVVVIEPCKNPKIVMALVRFVVHVVVVRVLEGSIVA